MKKRVLFLGFRLDKESREHNIYTSINHNNALYQYYYLVKTNDELSQKYDFYLRLLTPAFMLPHAVHVESALDSAILLNLRPHIAVFSLYSWNIEQYDTLSRMIKSFNPETIIVAGGPEIYERPDFVKQYPNFDVIVEGDGELIFPKILHALYNNDYEQLEKINNISFKTPQGFKHNQTIPENTRYIQIPNWYKLEMSNDPALFKGTFAYLSTRGCRFACSYCLWAKQPFRSKPTNTVLEELSTLAKNKYIDTIHFFDYDFMQLYHTNPQLYQEIKKIIQSQHRKINVDFFTATRYLNDPDLPKIIKDINVRRVYIGVQSLNPEVLRAVNRAWTIRHLKALENVPYEIRDKIIVELIYPLPGETPESFLNGIKTLIQSGLIKLQLFQLQMLRGTRLRQEAKRFGIKFFETPPYYAYETATFPHKYVSVFSYLLDFFNSLIVVTGDQYHNIQKILSRPGSIDNVINKLLTTDNPKKLIDNMLIMLVEKAKSREFQTVRDTEFTTIDQFIEFLKDRGITVIEVLPDFHTKRLNFKVHDTETGNKIELFLVSKTSKDSSYKMGRYLKYGYRGEGSKVIDRIWKYISTQETEVVKIMYKIFKT